jgi:hypothetical protein
VCIITLRSCVCRCPHTSQCLLPWLSWAAMFCSACRRSTFAIHLYLPRSAFSPFDCHFGNMLTVSRFIENLFSLLGLLNTFRRSKTNRNQQGSFLSVFLLLSMSNTSAGKHSAAVVPHGRHHRQSDYSNRPESFASGIAVRALRLFCFF